MSNEENGKTASEVIEVTEEEFNEEECSEEDYVKKTQEHLERVRSSYPKVKAHSLDEQEEKKSSDEILKEELSHSYTLRVHREDIDEDAVYSKFDDDNIDDDSTKRVVLSHLEFDVKFMNLMQTTLDDRKKYGIMPMYMDHVRQCKAFAYVSGEMRGKTKPDIIYLTPTWSEGVMNLDIVLFDNIVDAFEQWKKCKSHNHRIESVAGYYPNARIGGGLMHYGWTCPDCGKWYKLVGSESKGIAFFDVLEENGYTYKDFDALLFADFIWHNVWKDNSECIDTLSSLYTRTV